MANKGSSRRDFLAHSAKLAAVAGVVAAGGRSVSAARGPALTVSVGPAPRPIGADDTIRFGLIGIGGGGGGSLGLTRSTSSASPLFMSSEQAENGIDTVCHHSVVDRFTAIYFHDLLIR